jgi:phosphate transport system substrate-binding protein
VSDRNDTISGSFLKEIQVLAIKDAKGDEYQPYQAYIAQNLYPYCRSVYVICSEPRTGLASGFTNFMAGDKGQRIILKSGLVPSTMPVRIVGFKEN